MVSVKQIIENIKKKLGIRFNKKLEQAMGLCNGQVRYWCLRNSLSLKLIDFCIKKGLSIDEMLGLAVPPSSELSDQHTKNNQEKNMSSIEKAIELLKTKLCMRDDADLVADINKTLGISLPATALATWKAEHSVTRDLLRYSAAKGIKLGSILFFGDDSFPSTQDQIAAELREIKNLIGNISVRQEDAQQSILKSLQEIKHIIELGIDRS